MDQTLVSNRLTRFFTFGFELFTALFEDFKTLKLY